MKQGPNLGLLFARNLLNFTRVKYGQKVVREKAVPFILLYLQELPFSNMFIEYFLDLAGFIFIFQTLSGPPTGGR
jgi:hypothetical protein